MEENFYQSAILTLSVPIFNNAQVSRNIALSKIELEKSRVAKEEALLELQNKIEQLQIEIINAISELEASAVALESAKLSFQAAEIRYKEGLISFMEYTEVKTRLFRSKLELLQAKFLYKFKLDILECYID